MKFLWFSLLMNVTVPILLADPGLFELDKSQVSVKVPFHLFDNKIVVPIRINDKVKLNFIVDSGVSQPILLNRKWGKRLGLDYVRDLKFHGAGNQAVVRARISTPTVKMQMPGVVGYQMTMVVLDYDILNLERFDIHGILGSQLLMRFVVKIDYQKKFLWLINPDKFNAPPEFHALDLELVNLKPHIRVVAPDYSSTPLQILVDTGASYSLLLYHRSGDKIKGNPSSLWYGMSGRITGYNFITPILKIGCLQLTNLKTVLVKPKNYSKTALSAERSGSIGAGFLKGYTVIFNYGNSKMYLKPHDKGQLVASNVHQTQQPLSTVK